MRVSFVSASGQNVFFDELLHALRSELQRAGIETVTAVDHYPPLSDDLAYVVVPHEYVPLTMPSAHPSAAQLRRTVVLATEQPGTQWFEEAAHVAAMAGATVDINRLGLDELRRRGISARLLPLGYVPEWDYWHGSDEPRPIDVTFLGGYTPRRAAAVASCGRVLSDRRASLHLAESSRPHTSVDARFLSGVWKFRHLAASRILLNAHRQEYAYLEWLRLLGAAANGCVLLTEHSTAFEPLVPGEHFVSVGIENLPTALATLLDDEEYLRQVRHAVYEFLRSEFPLSAGIQILVEAVEEVCRQPVPSNASSVDAAPAPKDPPLPLPAYTDALAEPNESRLLRMGLKKVILQQRRVEQQLEQPVKAETVSTHGPYDLTKPRISVVLTVYNYAHVVRDAIASVAQSTERAVELVVVDDASRDTSLTHVEAALSDHPWLAAKVIARATNGGLPAARNLGIEHARGEYIFILDADNVVYPHGLGRLAQALDEDEEAAFAYGIIEKFDSTGSVGLLSWLPWDQRQFRYGNYIDAMALVRRAALERVGGFMNDERLFGWEDFALWCSFAQLGLRGTHVPEIVARYRTSRNSMISLTNIDTTEAWTMLIERFPFLLEADEQAAVSDG